MIPWSSIQILFRQLLKLIFNRFRNLELPLISVLVNDGDESCLETVECQGQGVTRRQGNATITTLKRWQVRPSATRDLLPCWTLIWWVQFVCWRSASEVEVKPRLVRTHVNCNLRIRTCIINWSQCNLCWVFGRSVWSMRYSETTCDSDTTIKKLTSPDSEANSQILEATFPQ